MNKKISFFLLALLIAFAVIFNKELFSFSKSLQFSSGARSHVGTVSIADPTEDVDVSLNVHLKETERRRMLKEVKVELLRDPSESLDYIEFGEDDLAKVPEGLSLGQDEHMGKSLKDLEAIRQKVDRVDPEADLQEERFRLNLEQARREDSEKEFVKSFLERARADGYEVILNNKLEVIEVRKVQEEIIYNPR